MKVSDIPIILLAAGQSTRMRGRDKLLEEVDGMPLLRRQAMLAEAVTDGPVLVALPSPPHLRYEVLTGLEVTPVPVPDAPEGINASLRRCFAQISHGTEAAMILLADLPALTENDLKNTLQAVDLKSEKTIWRGATEDGKPGHPIVFKAIHFDGFAKLRGDTGGQDIVRAARDQTVLVLLEGQHARLDLDTPEDWDRWRAQTQGRDQERR